MFSYYRHFNLFGRKYNEDFYFRKKKAAPDQNVAQGSHTCMMCV